MQRGEETVTNAEKDRGERKRGVERGGEVRGRKEELGLHEEYITDNRLNNFLRQVPSLLSSLYTCRNWGHQDEWTSPRSSR